MEQALQQKLDHYEQTHDYDEYHYELDDIGHDPYVLTAILSAMHPGEWTLQEVMGTLEMLFEKQYILTETVESETRYRTETVTGERHARDPVTGAYLYDQWGYPIMEEYEYETQVPYIYRSVTVKLENFDLSHVPVYVMNEETLGRYALYMAALSNRPDLFPDSDYIQKHLIDGYTDYEIPPDALEDAKFAAMIKEAEVYCYCILFCDKLQNTFMLWGKIQMTDAQQEAAAKQFVKDWTGHGDEKQETQRFWIALLQNVFGVERATNAIEFEVPVKLGHTSFIDGYLKDTNVLIEQKGADIDLRKGYKQSDGSMLTPFQQARRYAGYLPHNMNPRWIVVCNFKEFHIHDMNRPNDTPEVIALSELEKEYHRLQFLVDTGNERIQKEMQISL